MATNKLFIALIIATLFAASCQKNGEVQKVLTYSEITVAWNYNPYPTKPFSVIIDGQPITDSLMYQSADTRHLSATKIILGDNNPKKFVLKDVETGNVVLDTLIELSGQKSIALLALSATDKPAIAGGGEQPTDPLSRDSAKYSYIYNDPKLPDSVLVKFYAGDGAVFPEYDPHPFDSVVLKRNEFSRYISFPWAAYDYPTFYFELIDAKTLEFIQPIDKTSTFEGYAYGVATGQNFQAPTTVKFTKMLIRFADPDEWDIFRINRFYDLILSETPW
jgi:hypothetical protein